MPTKGSPPTKFLSLDFFERQKCNSSCSSKKHREISLQQRRNVAALENSWHVLTGGAGDVQGLKSFLKHHFGTVARGWRKGLDIRDVGRISEKDFGRALINCGFTGNIQTLWRNVSNRAPHVTLDHIDANLCAHLDWVVEQFYNTYDSVEDLWAGLASERANAAHLSKFEFTGALKKAGLLPPDWKDWFKPELVFRMLDAEGRSQVNLEDFKYLETWAKQRGLGPVPDELLQASYASVPKHRQSVILERREAIAKAQMQAQMRKCGAVDLREFRQLLERRFGSVVNAWQAGLDLDGNGKLTLREFTHACRNIGFTGALQSLWADLDKKGVGYITLGDLDRESYDALETLQKEVINKYGNLSNAWQHLLDTDGSGKVDRTEFVEACKAVGLGPAVGQKIFGCIDSDSTGCITPEELTFLETWGGRGPAKKYHSFDDETYISKWRAKINHREMKVRMLRSKSLAHTPTVSRGALRGWREDEPGGFYKRSLQLLANHDDRFSMFSTWS